MSLSFQELVCMFQSKRQDSGLILLTHQPRKRYISNYTGVPSLVRAAACFHRLRYRNVSRNSRLLELRMFSGPLGESENPLCGAVVGERKMVWFINHLLSKDTIIFLLSSYMNTYGRRLPFCHCLYNCKKAWPPMCVLQRHVGMGTSTK